MTPDVIAELNKEEQSPLNDALLTHVKALVNMSRRGMSKYYGDWDMQNEVFKGIRYLDSDDRAQALRGKPTKMVVPNTFAQVMTFSSFLFLMYNQNRTFFELTPTGDEDRGQKETDCETIIERDLRHNQWNSLLFQHLLDVGRFGPAINEVYWTRKTVRAYIAPQPTVVNLNSVDVPVRSGSEWQEFVKYEGNQICAVSPYRFFPDTRFPLVDFQKGEFCAAEEEFARTRLKDLEKVGEVAGIDRVQKLAADWAAKRGAETRTIMSIGKDNMAGWLQGPSNNASEGTVLVTKVQVRLIPNNFTYGDNKKLGPEEYPILYHVWYANDNRVIRAEPAYWWHDNFGWSVSHFTPDMHETINLGLADLIYRLQDVITWHINARITDVRRNMKGRLVVDPAGVDTSTLDGDGDIYLRKSASKSGVNRWVLPLNMQDVTQGHMQDAEMLGKIMEVVTGVNGNAMGQYNSGRRSAAESRVVTAGAAGRMKMHGQLIWDKGIAPLGQMMLSNSRQSLSRKEFGKVVGQDDDTDARYTVFQGTPEEIITGDDYFTFDSTLASEKGFIAQSLQELMVAIISNPVAAQQLDLDPRKILEEIQLLRGAGSVKRFSLSAGIQNGTATALPPAVVPGPAGAAPQVIQQGGATA